MDVFETNAKELYNQLLNNSGYMKLLVWSTLILMLALWINYMFSFFFTLGLSNKKKKKIMKRKRLAGSESNDSYDEESKAYNPNPKEMLIKKFYNYEFQKKRLTSHEIDLFLSELRNPGILVKVLGAKGESPKQKILRLDKDGSLYWSKESTSDLLVNLFVRSQLLKTWPCTSITDVYLAETDELSDTVNSFILELKGGQKIHLSTYPPLTAQRMVTAWKSLVSRLRKEPECCCNIFVDRNCQGAFTIESAIQSDNETAAILRRIEE